MLSVLIFFLVLSVLVITHELGHYVAARAMGVKADEFGFGFPPRAIGFVRENGKWRRVKKNEDTIDGRTIWSVNWLPLGGFVRLKGEAGEDGGDQTSFLSKKAGPRILILIAGVLMNWLITILIFSIGFGIGVPAQTQDLPASAIVRDQKVQITDVMPGSAADKAGLLPGDFLLAVDGKPATNVDQARQELAGTTAPLRLSIERHHQALDVSATQQYVAELNRPGLGIALADTGNVRFPWPEAFLQGFLITIAYTKELFMALGNLLMTLITSFRVSAELSGPIGIAVMTGQIVQQGVWPVLQFAALLSLNLAVVNVLPIPALDGGRILFVLLESVRRKRTDPKLEAMFHRIGFILLLILIALITLHDIRQYGGVILGGLRSLVGI